eukprot:g5351.t1
MSTKVDPSDAPLSPSEVLYVLDYGAGNVRSLYNAIRSLGYCPKQVSSPEDIRTRAKKLIFPGVGSFGSAMSFLKKKGYFEPLKEYVKSGKPYFGVCIGMQALFESSEESLGAKGLGIISAAIEKFPVGKDLPAVPHIGWNEIRSVRSSAIIIDDSKERYYFVHSFRARATDDLTNRWALTLTDYGNDTFVSAVQRGAVVATQFHPEKSGKAGLRLIERFLAANDRDFETPSPSRFQERTAATKGVKTAVSRRLIAALDVRPNDDGRLVVTKGDGYDVRDKDKDGAVRNLGDPVDLASRYYRDGADEIVFLNIKAGAVDTLSDSPMMRVLERASEKIFVPLTIGGGIRSYTSKSGTHHSALDVASAYFRAGADKVSIGSAAVAAAEAFLARGEVAKGDSCIESITKVYGRQAVVVSIDPRRVHLADDAACAKARKAGHTVVRCASSRCGTDGETRCWYQCTVKGGRETRPLDAVRFARCCESLGAGELMINCIDQDGRKQGFDVELVRAICDAVTIPVIASSGAGCPGHFSEVFETTRCEAALGAGIFHRREVEISDVKRHMSEKSIPARA